MRDVPLTPEEARNWQEGFELLRPHLWRVFDDLRRGYDVCPTDIEQACEDAIVEALEEYDPNRADTFVAYYRQIAKNRVKSLGRRRVRVSASEHIDETPAPPTNNELPDSEWDWFDPQHPEEFLKRAAKAEGLDADEREILEVLSKWDRERIVVLFNLYGLYGVGEWPEGVRTKLADFLGVDANLITKWKERLPEALAKLQGRLLKTSPEEMPSVDP